MTESITPINVANDAWVDLVNRLNEVIDALQNNVVSTGGAVTGDIGINGTLAATNVLSDGAALVTAARTISTINGIEGGGNLNTNLTLTLSSTALDGISKGATSIQPNDLNGNAAFIPQKMTTSERNNISSPAAGRMIYNTSVNKPQYYNGTAWVDMSV